MMQYLAGWQCPNAVGGGHKNALIFLIAKKQIIGLNNYCNLSTLNV